MTGDSFEQSPEYERPAGQAFAGLPDPADSPVSGAAFVLFSETAGREAGFGIFPEPVGFSPASAGTPGV